MISKGTAVTSKGVVRHSMASKSKKNKFNVTEVKNMKKIKVKLTFTEEILGTANATTTIHDEYIASKAPDAKSREEEIAALGVAEVVENL